MGLFSRLTPKLVDQASSAMVKSQIGSAPNHQAGSLWQPGQDGSVTGGESGIRPSSYTAAYVHPGIAAAVLGGIGISVGLAVWAKSR